MLAGRRIALLTGVCAMLLAACAGGLAGAAEDAAPEQYWLGPYFAGLRLTHTGKSPGLDPAPTDKAFSYGDCELPEGEGGCSVPVDIQNVSSCARNPMGLDRLPQKVFALRGGGLAVQYESTAVDVGIGDRTVTVYAEYELMGAALRELRPVGQEEPQALAPPTYPMPVLRELKRVTAVRDRFKRIDRIARATGLRPEEVTVRLQIADLLGPDALADVPPPTMSVAAVERLRQIAFRAQFNPARYARENKISKAALERKLRRVRGLTGAC
jgi:hypothetical protein